MSATTQQTQDRDHALIEWFESFLDQEYREKIIDLARHFPSEQKSLYVEYSDVHLSDPEVAEEWLDMPDRFQAAAEDALAAFDLPVTTDLEDAHVRLTDTDGYVETKSVTELGSDDIGEYRAVHGVLDRITKVSPRIENAAFECLRCGTITMVPQNRAEMQDPYQCQGCERDGPYHLDASKSEFVDVRQVKLSQPPEERVKKGGEGESILVYVEDDLVDVGGKHGLSDRAGEHVTVFGQILLAEGQMSSKSQKSPIYDEYLDAQAIEFKAEDYDEVDVEAYSDELEALEERAGDDLIEAYRDSIAPTIQADDTLETALEAAVAWLFNAYRVDPDGRGSFRGDIHMGLIGDPGLGKSSILSALAEIAPKSEFRSGTGLSAVGLTAAAVQEEFAGQSEWTLQPGILPRANGGHCIIDEVDDVVDEDTKKMHDALEGDQMVKVDKAGIHADLPTRTALFISGNPTDGRFDRYEVPAEQVDLDPALISRLDVLFGLRDIPDPEPDADVAGHILESWDELSRMEVAERVSAVDPPEETKATEPEIPHDVFRAAVTYARQEIFPVLTEESKEILQQYYVDVRSLNDGEDDPIPATPRTLEAGIRLAIAFARAEFKDEVLPRHAQRAISISREVIGLNYDPDTGKYDADRMTKGTPKSQRDRLKVVKGAIDELQPDGKGGADLEEVLDTLEEDGIERSKAEHSIEKLKSQGRAYEPRNGEVRVT